MKNTRGSDKRCGSKPGLPFYLGGRFGVTSCKLSPPKEKDSFPPSQKKATASPTISAKNDILPIYFDAMIAGYLSKTESDKLVRGTNSNGSMKDITYTDGDFIVYDTWCDYFGFTLVRWRGYVVWQMSYVGEYEAKAIPALKQALRLSFEERDWRGGRGPAFLEVGDCCYRNDILLSNNPRDFGGRESIHERGRCLGHHDYLGHANLKFVTP